ncbi:tRNA lysidine(34) synthetase [Candidatus Neptunochlamydia vexilliferae]|uniref:tRNA 2-thiocytidine biosynthesis protein TtcA 2 n=1 Tax=Candidatus Neptunichlamydia vexilliferae TaxID=1651774 RepID=A0ABS0AZN0_9BACT|nr:tRNA 2-thiocytidine biosynthesis TtcA family protein [Candidatus Neptunochlamydia vexilliferae]MBF5059577.1 tRNA 2-thiocytidine biosynthesis protein TtcA 2 [Candidatus Neptunochlamydia vexilliferae]
MTQLRKKIESACRKALFDFQLLEGAEGIAVALSGGKDSITLLLMLKAILGRGFPDLPLHAIHVTGEFSCGASVQESFLRGICDKLEVPLIIRESTQKRETLACYRCSRERRRLIFDAAKEVGAPVVAFGHHEDDSIQTLLLNLLHKGEFAANLPKVPMYDYGVTIIRPLIYVSEKALYEFAKQEGYARITCQCPVGQNSKRMEVKKLLEEIKVSFPNVETNLAQAALKYGSKKAISR